DAVALLVGELVAGRAAVVGRDRVATRLGGEAGLRAARADHLLDRLEHVTHAHSGADALRRPVAALLGDLPGAAVAVEGVRVHFSSAHSTHARDRHGTTPFSAACARRRGAE